MDDRLFIRGENGELYEGPLGENAYNIKLLFVMKEPNGEELNCFWLKQVFKGKETGTRYFNNLNIYIEKLFGRKAEIKDELLNKMAFINLFPFFGKSHVVEGKGYSALIQDSVWEDAKTAELKKQITVNDNNKTILRNRIEIIKNALDNGAYVVAHYEIVDMLAKIDKNIVRVNPKVEERDHHIAAYIYKGKNQIFSVQHPQSTQITDDEIKKCFDNIRK